MSCLLLSQNIVFCKSSLLCKLWALQYWAMEQESLTRSVRSPPTSTLPTTTRRLHVLGGEGEAKNRMDFSGGLDPWVLFCFSALLLLGLFSIIYLDRHYGSFYSSANKVDGWINILPQKTRPMGCTDAPVISGGSSEGKHGHPVSCENCLQRWILHHRVTRIYGDAWCSKSPDSADSCWGVVSTSAGSCHGRNRTNGFNGWEDVTPNKVTRYHE